ncbi:hypothetical protein JL720_7820 [Aureococcus anophagefferens]|nr:hypothetical protein JL720_7820 [Aureococcus anophagefferens]
MSSRSMSVSNSRPTDATESVREHDGQGGESRRAPTSRGAAALAESESAAELPPADDAAAPELPPLEADDGYDDGYDDDEEDDFFAPPAEDAPVKSRKRKLEEAIAAQHVSAHSLERDYKETAPRRPRRRTRRWSRRRGRARGADAAGEVARIQAELARDYPGRHQKPKPAPGVDKRSIAPGHGAGVAGAAGAGVARRARRGAGARAARRARRAGDAGTCAAHNDDRPAFVFDGVRGNRLVNSAADRGAASAFDVGLRNAADVAVHGGLKAVDEGAFEDAAKPRTPSAALMSDADRRAPFQSTIGSSPSPSVATREPTPTPSGAAVRPSSRSAA